MKNLWILCVVFAAAAILRADEGKPDFSLVPGVVIDHSPASSGRYVGSPSIVILHDGSYLASHDWFGPKTTEHTLATTAIFRSADRGKTWTHVADIEGAFWSTLFVHDKAAYLIGPTAHHGKLVIRRSTDDGKTWTSPTDSNTGLLRDGQFHCAPVPVIVYNGRIWRAIEDAGGGKEWGKRYRAMMLSAPVNADLLKADSWTTSNFIARDPSWLGGHFVAWLEGNAVVSPTGGIVDILRVEVGGAREMAAIVDISPDGTHASFNPSTGFVEFPGGRKKFTIRYDDQSKLYWALSNAVPPKSASGASGNVRNTLALISSPDLRQWKVNAVLLHHPDSKFHAFQYVDWNFDGQDIIVASRTAYDDGLGGAHNFHDANFLTFHRFENFRTLTTTAFAPASTEPTTTASAVPAKPFGRRVLVSDYSGNKVAIISTAGEIEWQFPATRPQDVWMLKNGNVLFSHVHGAREVTLDSKIVWEYVSPDKTEVHGCQPLPNGNVLVVECGAKRLVEVGRDGKIVREIPVPVKAVKTHLQMRGCRQTLDGRYWISATEDREFLELDHEGKLLRELKGLGEPLEVRELPNGHLLLACGEGRSAVELDQEGNTVWKLVPEDVPNNPLRLISGFQRLPDGHTIIVNWLGHGHIGTTAQFFELDASKKIIRQFTDHAHFVSINQVQILDVPGDPAKGEILR